MRVSGLPLGYLSSAWVWQALQHVGFIDQEVDAEASSLLDDPEIKAEMLVDLSRPLIPGYFLPLYDSQVIWVFFL